jgi:hypothetical protein
MKIEHVDQDDVPIKFSPEEEAVSEQDDWLNSALLFIPPSNPPSALLAFSVVEMAVLVNFSRGDSCVVKSNPHDLIMCKYDDNGMLAQ